MIDDVHVQYFMLDNDFYEINIVNNDAFNKILWLDFFAALDNIDQINLYTSNTYIWRYCLSLGSAQASHRHTKLYWSLNIFCLSWNSCLL